MGKIYDGDTKLNVVQVCDKLRNEITPEQAKAFAGFTTKYEGQYTTAKAQFAHMALDAYKGLPNTTDHDMMVRKLTKHLLDKYMKSSSTMEGEDSAFRLLISDIAKKSEE